MPAVGGGRAAVLEILLDTPRIKDLVKRGDIDAIKDAMEQGSNEGCRTFDSALFDLVMIGRVDETDALRAADSPNNLRIAIDRYRRSGGQEVEPTKLRLVQPGKLHAVRK